MTADEKYGNFRQAAREESVPLLVMMLLESFMANPMKPKTIVTTIL